MFVNEQDTCLATVLGLSRQRSTVFALPDPPASIALLVSTTNVDAKNSGVS
jgi:hypothetical protein